MESYASLAVPPEGHVSLCYMDGRLCWAPSHSARLEDITKEASQYPEINISREVQRNSASCEDYHDVFCHVNTPLLQRLFHAWYENGIFEALRYAANECDEIPALLQSLAAAIVSIAHLFGISRRPRGTPEEIAGLVAQTRGWERSNVRAMDWSPLHHRLAVAAHDDSVRIFSDIPTSKEPVLKCKGHNNITCVSWRPTTDHDIAVGSAAGVALWDVEPRALTTRTVRILAHPGQSSVTSITWSPAGDLLLSASTSDSVIYVWDADNDRSSCLKQILGGGISLVTWSPSHQWVFSATMGCVFRVWETDSWDFDRWTIPSGHVRTACWSGDGDVLLFATTEDTWLYGLFLTNNQPLLQMDQMHHLIIAKRVFDLTPTEIATGERVGGLVATMDWDSTSQFLAIIFAHSDLIMVYRTSITHTLDISPFCIVRGRPNQIPNIVKFKPGYSDGALLTIAWSNGQVQYFPILEKPFEFVERNANCELPVNCPVPRGFS